MRLHRPPHDFGRICCRILILLGCAALHAIQHLHLLYFAGTHRWARRDLFNNRVLLLPHPLRDFGRICRRVLRFLGCLAFEQHVHLRFRRHAVQKGPKGCRVANQRKQRTLRLGCRLRIGLRKPERPLRWSLRLRAIPCTVPCQVFHFPTIRASHHPSTLSLPSPCPATVL